MNRVYIFTGKGGVGKSSVAAAHAKKSELQRKKTLLISTERNEKVSCACFVERIYAYRSKNDR